MLVSLFLRGVLIGVLASIPLGPVGIICVQRALSKNQKSGFISGLGAGLADTFYATLGFFALTFIQPLIEKNIILVKVIAALCVIIAGVIIFMSNPAVQIRRNRAGVTSPGRDFITVFLITIANPALVFLFIGLFAAFGLSIDNVGMMNGWLLLGGVALGTIIWWLTLSSFVSLFRNKIRPRHILWINKISGSIIVLLGAAVVLTVFVNIPIHI